QAATWCAKRLHAHLLEGLEHDGVEEGAPDASAQAPSPFTVELVSRAAEAGQEGLPGPWAAQDALLARLPAALRYAFLATEKEFNARTRISGTTATVVVVCGWEAVVANVGDSLAFFDTGKEVVRVSGNHRLDDNKVEVARCEAAGNEIGQAVFDGIPDGPLRVWPGGLMMARTIGDLEAGAVVTADPEVKQFTIPQVIASDGLWDVMQPKVALHQVRGMRVAAATPRLMYLGLHKKTEHDDITILVADLLPEPDCKLPPHMAFAAQKKGAPPMEPPKYPAPDVTPWHPLPQSALEKGEVSGMEGGEMALWRSRVAVRRAYVLNGILAEKEAAAQRLAEEEARLAAEEEEARAQEQARQAEAEAERLAQEAERKRLEAQEGLAVAAAQQQHEQLKQANERREAESKARALQLQSLQAEAANSAQLAADLAAVAADLQSKAQKAALEAEEAYLHAARAAQELEAFVAAQNGASTQLKTMLGISAHAQHQAGLAQAQVVLPDAATLGMMGVVSGEEAQMEAQLTARRCAKGGRGSGKGKGGKSSSRGRKGGKGEHQAEFGLVVEPTRPVVEPSSGSAGEEDLWTVAGSRHPSVAVPGSPKGSSKGGKAKGAKGKGKGKGGKSGAN
ncbi:hypothetical protein CYMTET_14019, partial [Cymbomonas tetramitiformis]